MTLQAFDPDQNPVDSQVGITPLFVKLRPTLFRIVGTGFYIARYGLLLTAKHVVDEISEYDSNGYPAAAWLWKPDGTVNFRPIVSCHFDDRAPQDAPDIAICQVADNAHSGTTQVAQANERIALLTSVPSRGSSIATYAYPDNHGVDFSAPDRVGRVFADAFHGEVLELVGPQERFFRYPHLETTIEIRGGASGGPVFGQDGHAFAVNCRGWDLGADDDSEPLSSIVPVSLILDLGFPYPLIPSGAWEERVVPIGRRGKPVTLRDLATWGHIKIDPPTTGHAPTRSSR